MFEQLFLKILSQGQNLPPTILDEFTFQQHIIAHKRFNLRIDGRFRSRYAHVQIRNKDVYSSKLSLRYH